jgi:putative transposase
MTATRRATFKLYPIRAVEEILLYQIKLDRLLDRACVYHQKPEYQKFGKSVSYINQKHNLPAFKQEWIDYKNINLHAFQATIGFTLGWGSL